MGSGRRVALRVSGLCAEGAGQARLADPAAGPVDTGGIDFGATGLVSVFIRHALGPEPPLAGATERNPVLLSDPALQRKSRMSDRQQVRRNEKAGYEVRIVPGPETSESERRFFHTAYTETMERVDADESYLYEAAYFDAILAAGRRGWRSRATVTVSRRRHRSSPAATESSTTT